MIKQRKIELLAPAKNMECGIEAINHLSLIHILHFLPESLFGCFLSYYLFEKHDIIYNLIINY